MPRGCDGSSFELTLRHGRRRVTAGWWLGSPSWPVRQLGSALERLTMSPLTRELVGPTRGGLLVSALGVKSVWVPKPEMLPSADEGRRDAGPAYDGGAAK
jgi:hypothetical protein